MHSADVRALSTLELLYVYTRPPDRPTAGRGPSLTDGRAVAVLLASTDRRLLAFALSRTFFGLTCSRCCCCCSCSCRSIISGFPQADMASCLPMCGGEGPHPAQHNGANRVAAVFGTHGELTDGRTDRRPCCRLSISCRCR
jgi:hypothetical protein